MKKNKKIGIKYIYYYLGAHMRNTVIDFQPKETKKINKTKLAITISIIVVLLTISILAIIYCLNKNLEMLWMFICLEKISQVKIQQQLI